MAKRSRTTAAKSHCHQGKKTARTLATAKCNLLGKALAYARQVALTGLEMDTIYAHTGLTHDERWVRCVSVHHRLGL